LIHFYKRFKAIDKDLFKKQLSRSNKYSETEVHAAEQNCMFHNCDLPFGVHF